MKSIIEVKVVSEVKEDEKERVLRNLKDENRMNALKSRLAYELMHEDGRDETIQFKFTVEGEWKKWMF